MVVGNPSFFSLGSTRMIDVIDVVDVIDGLGLMICRLTERF
jgi:hypothetical protein